MFCDQRGRAGDERSGDRVHEPVVAGHEHNERDKQWIKAPQHLRHTVADDQQRRDGDHQRERDVHARHGGVGIEEERDEPGVVLDVHVVGDGVHEPELGEEARRRRGHQHITHQRQAHRHHEHVAHEVEAVVVAQVEPHERARRHHEVRVDVHEVGHVDQHPLTHRPRLESLLEEQPGALLEVDDRAGVRERDRGIGLRDAAYRLVQDVRDHEQGQLHERVGTTLWQPAQARRAPGATGVPAEDPGERQQQDQRNDQPKHEATNISRRFGSGQSACARTCKLSSSARDVAQRARQRTPRTRSTPSRFRAGRPARASSRRPVPRRPCRARPSSTGSSEP